MPVIIAPDVEPPSDRAPRITGAALLVAALWSLAVAVQIVLAASRHPLWILAGEVGFVLLAVAQLVTGVKTYNAQVLWNVLGVAAAAAGIGAGVLWFVLLFMVGGALSPLPLVSAVVSGITAVIAAIAVPQSLRVTRFRQGH